MPLVVASMLNYFFLVGLALFAALFLVVFLLLVAIVLPPFVLGLRAQRPACALRHLSANIEES